MELGPPPEMEDTTGALEAKEGSKQCRNYGCNKWYLEEENNDTSCLHHIAAPIFHETRKGWSCCRDRLVYDWDEFVKVRMLFRFYKVGKEKVNLEQLND